MRCDRPHHIRCADDPNVGADEPWFCGDACRRGASSKIEPSARGKSSERRAAPHEKAAPASDAHASKRAKKSRCRARGTRGARGTRVDSVFRGCRTEERARLHEAWMARGSNGRHAPRDVSSTTPTPRSRATAVPSRDTRRALAVYRDVIVISDDEEDREEKEGSKRARGFEDAAREPRTGVDAFFVVATSVVDAFSTVVATASAAAAFSAFTAAFSAVAIPPTIGPSFHIANWFAWKLASKISSHARNVPSPSRRRSRRATPTATTRSSPRRSESGRSSRERGWGRGRGVGVSGYRGVHRAGSRWVAVGFERWRRTRTDGRTSGASTLERRRAGVRRVGRVAREDAQRRRRRRENRRRTTRRRRRARRTPSRKI